MTLSGLPIILPGMAKGIESRVALPATVGLELKNRNKVAFEHTSLTRALDVIAAAIGTAVSFARHMHQQA